MLVNSQHMKGFLAPQHENGLKKTFELEDKWTLDWVIFLKIHIHSKKTTSEQLCKVLTQLSNEEMNLKIYFMQFLKEEYIWAVQARIWNTVYREEKQVLFIFQKRQLEIFSNLELLACTVHPLSIAVSQHILTIIPTQWIWKNKC